LSIKIDVVIVPAELPEQGLAGKTVAVIDVLRASTSMVAALEAGAKEIIPLASIEEATRLAETMGRDTVVLCGERDGNKINGFDLGNSPLEFTPENVKGKSLLMATTNGTVAVARAKGAALIAVGCLINAKALVPVLTEAQAIARSRTMLPADFCGPDFFVAGCDAEPEFALGAWRIYFHQYRGHTGIKDRGGLAHTYIILDPVGNCIANIPGTEPGAPR
jgi:phosphosulfolactate phosphohydrolase-like enzyme